MKRRPIPVPSEEIQERFWEKVEFTDFECWTWSAAMRSTDGIGVFGFNKLIYYAHRVAYVITKGDIPQNRDVRRSCNNSLCVRPSHLYLADPKEPLETQIGSSGLI